MHWKTRESNYMTIVIYMIKINTTELIAFAGYITFYFTVCNLSLFSLYDSSLTGEAICSNNVINSVIITIIIIDKFPHYVEIIVMRRVACSQKVSQKYFFL